ncbi:MAG TPA: alkaline phosphatase family protein [Anaerolineales bacterium]|nr:alkaline phosphatase family protein [Anaerolineales bacterium]
MKKIAPILMGVFICILVMGGSYIWAMRLMDSVYEYKSPLHNSAPIRGDSIGSPITRSLVIVLIDGLNYGTSMDASTMPFLNQLRSQGATAKMHSLPPSYSQAAYTVLLTGAWSELNDGPIINWDFTDIPTLTQDNIFSDAHWVGMQTAISGFNWFEKLVPQGAVSAKFYTAGEDQVADREVVDAALPWLKEGKYQLMLIHLDQVDYAGHHEGGPIDPRWNAAAKRVDDLLKEITTSMNLTQETLLVVSDHGHIDYGGHGGQDAIVLQEPFVLVGKGVMPGNYGDVQMVDVAPTVATILGTNIPATNQGHPQVAMLDITLDQISNINALIALQQNELVQAYQTAVGSPVTIRPSSDVVTASQAGIIATQDNILNTQMLPRGLIAIIVVLLLINLAAWHSRPYFGAMILGIAGYLLVFNVKYVLIDHKTYSLSSVVDATNLIASSALTTLLALLVGWILVMIGTKIYQFKPRKAADVTMKFILVMLAVLSIPIFLHYAMNGAIVTWALPNFLISFLGLIFLIQTLVVAAIGILFTGLAALLGALARQR